MLHTTVRMPCALQYHGSALSRVSNRCFADRTTARMGGCQGWTAVLWKTNNRSVSYDDLPLKQALEELALDQGSI